MVSKYKSEAVSLIAMVAVMVIIFSSLYFYTGNWPPAVIVESSSMQHGNNFVLYAINTGDIVGVKKISNFTSVETYLVAREKGSPWNYGEFGDVIVYRDYFIPELVIHRAIFYVEGWNGSVPILYGNDNPSWLSIQGSEVYITDVGYAHKNLLVDLRSYVGQTGFVTMGDHNLADSPVHNGNYTIAADQNVNIDNSLVNASQVIGYAVGHLPIVGVFKVWLTRNQADINDIPIQSSEAMVVIIAAVVLLIIAPIPSMTLIRKRTEERKK